MSESVPVSVLIPTLNEASNIVAALESVRGADEVVVVDSRSVDGTAEIAEEHGATVVRFDYVPGGAKKKTWALSNVPFRNDWIFILDADERVPPELWEEIGTAIRHPVADGYLVDREYVFLGRSLRCFRPNWNLRLFRNGKGQMEDLGLHGLPDVGDNEIHEHVELDGRLGFLTNPLLHDDFKDMTSWMAKHNRYASWEAHLYRRFRQEPLGVTPLQFVRLDPFRRKRVLRRLWVRVPFRPLIRFFVWYVLRQGFRDGRAGFIFCVLMAHYEFLITAKLHELNTSERGLLCRGS